MKPSAACDREREAHLRGEFALGVDEVGRGCLAGPVVAAAVLFDWSKPEVLDDLAKRFSIRDSKTLSRKQRIVTSVAIRDAALFVGIGQVDARGIDEMNILQATFLAMRQAVDDLFCKASLMDIRKNAFVFVDGNQRVPHFPYNQESVVRGDANVFSIAAASIIAKEYRDTLMEQFDEQYPGYSFSAHKGYGTKVHCAAIRSLGLSPLHRVTFWHE